MAENPTISQITLPSGSTYDIKDAEARSDIQDIWNSISGGIHYLGTTTTELYDGSTTSTIIISGNSHSAVNGDMVNYGSKEFVWDGSKWQEMGDLGAFKALAYKDTASATYTPAGSVSQPTFTGTQGSVSVSGSASGNVAISIGTGTANYTPEGTVSQPSFTGTSFNSTGNYTPEGSVTISTGTGTANYTPAGSVTVTPSTTTVNSITAVGTLPSWTASVANENLTLGWSAGTLPTKGSDTTVATGISSASFSGTGTQLKGTFSGTQKSVTVSGTATGSVSQPTFTGTGAVLTGSFSGTSKTVTVSGTATGSVSQPTFSGTGKELKATFTGTNSTFTGNFTPEGTVSQPTFTGTQATITVS